MSDPDPGFAGVQGLGLTGASLGKRAGRSLKAARAAQAFNKDVPLWTVVLAFWPWEARGADRSQIERGKYLVTLGGCGDCHTPGYFLGKPP
jgi:hypothetical protein